MSLSIADFLLPPRSSPESRICHVGPLTVPGPIDPGTVILPVQRGDPSSFASLALMLATIRELPTVSAHFPALTELLARLDRVRSVEHAMAAQHTLDGAALASRGVLAALRRVTRESVEIALITERVARSLAQALVLPAVRSVVVPLADQIDRPSLKTLIRACLIAESPNAPVWHWHVPAIPQRPVSSFDVPDFEQVAHEVRCDMLRKAFAVLRPTLEHSSPRTPSVEWANNIPFVDFGPGTACNWLMTQNYDAALGWAAQALRKGQPIDALRVAAIASTNVGHHDLALHAFKKAYDACGRPTQRAHLCAMLALIIAKRKFDLVASRFWYDRGLSELEETSYPVGKDGDPALEKAWILNGLALNELLAARLLKRPITDAFKSTFDFLAEAFDLVKTGAAPDYVYLRYNLLGNMSAFMSLQGEHRLARELFERAFDPCLTEGLADALEWRAVLTTRRAGLYASAGETEAALQLYRDAIDMLVDSDRPVCAETIRRSAGVLALRLGRPKEAEASFRKGLVEASETRSAIGVRVHGAGLIVSLVQQQRLGEASNIFRELGETEGVWLADATTAPSRAALSVKGPSRIFGLSTSIPEIDLEYIEPVNISAVLSGSTAVPRPIASGL